MSFPNLEILTLSPPPSSLLLSLPAEIQGAILSHLDYPTKSLLRQTCHHFSTLIPSLNSLDALLDTERSDDARELNILSCAVCLRLRRGREFGSDFRKGKWGRDGWKRETRFCIDCGTKPIEGADPKLRYRKGDTWDRHGTPYVKCKACGSVRRGAKERRDCEVCPSCWKSGRGQK